MQSSPSQPGWHSHLPSLHVPSDPHPGSQGAKKRKFKQKRCIGQMALGRISLDLEQSAKSCHESFLIQGMWDTNSSGSVSLIFHYNSQSIYRHEDTQTFGRRAKSALLLRICVTQFTFYCHQHVFETDDGLSWNAAYVT